MRTSNILATLLAKVIIGTSEALVAQLLANRLRTLIATHARVQRGLFFQFIKLLLEIVEHVPHGGRRAHHAGQTCFGGKCTRKNYVRILHARRIFFFFCGSPSALSILVHYPGNDN